MIHHTLTLLNDFIKTIHYFKDNDFKESDFTTSRINHEENSHEHLVESYKDKQVTYKKITFTIRFLVIINDSTDELYGIHFGCTEVNQDNHIIVSEYLSQMMIFFIDYFSKELFLSIDESENIVEFFRLYVEKRKEGYYPLTKGIVSIIQGEFEIAHQFYNQRRQILFYAVANEMYNIFLQLILPIDYGDINMN